MPVIAHQELRSFAAAVLEAGGSPPDLARIVADSLVDANLAGHDSHGVIRVAEYMGMVERGIVQPSARARVTRHDRGAARVDAAWGWGQPAMLLAADTAIELARAHALGAAIVERGFHIGRVAPYVQRIAAAGMIGMAFSNGWPVVAPHGGRERVLGTNPIAWAMPRNGEDPLSFDIATAGTAEGKLRVARAKGEQVPTGLLVDTEGHPSTDPNSFYDGGAILTFGGHKGYGINLLAQMLGHALGGTESSERDGRRGANEAMVIAIDITAFTMLDQFTGLVEAQTQRITASAPAEGSEGVRLPGESEHRTRRERSEAGIPIADATWQELLTLASTLDVAISPSLLQG